MHVVHACPLGCSHPSLINDEDHLRLGRLILDFELDVVVIEIGFLRKFLDPLGGSGVNLSLLRIGTQCALLLLLRGTFFFRPTPIRFRHVVLHAR